MLKITIIGSGNVAQHLITAFSNAVDIELIQVFSRNKNAVSHLINKTKIVHDFNDLMVADVFIIAVLDDVISEVSSKIPFADKLVVHTAGGMAIDKLDDKNRKGVFYPLQSFSKNKPVNFKEIPICLETESDLDYYLLEKIASSISNRIFKINSIQRKSLHISAVFVNNFVNHLYKIGNDICNENKVDFEILKPLILETAQKTILLSPIEAQTGPAKRKDNEVIDSHLQFLSNENQKEIYKILTHSIQQNV